ncbi:MAG: cytidylate kinase-like family protein [Armatimonadetes bacterium]|nr:cytidylate kinase-like family protein [Armatimonadota bacterium]
MGEWGKRETKDEGRGTKKQVIVNPVITISRTMGSGGRIVARKLADDLGFSLWDKELIDAIAAASEMPKSIVEAFDEKTISEIRLLIYAVLGNYDLSGFMYLKHLTRMAAAIASVGNAVILGRGVNFLLPNALNIRMDASLERRIENMVSYEGEDRHKAEGKIRKSDRERERFVMDVFGKERVRSFNYDVSLWLDKFTAAEAVEIIKVAYRGFYQSD